MATLQLGGESICYEKHGNGPALLMIHGLGSGAWAWEEQLHAWRSRYTAVAADARGHGETSYCGGATVEGNAADLALLMEALELRDTVIIGLSMGGVIAPHLYRLVPHRIRALALVGTFCHNPSGEERIAETAQRVERLGMTDFGHAYADETLLITAGTQANSALANSIATTDKEAYLQTVRSLFVQDTRHLLGEVQVPVQVLVGEKDNRTPLAQAQQVAASVPGAQLEVIPRSAHIANLDNPAGFRTALETFFARLGD